MKYNTPFIVALDVHETFLYAYGSQQRTQANLVGGCDIDLQ